MGALSIREITEHYLALNANVPLRPIRNRNDYARAVDAMNALLDAGAADESHPLADLAATLGELIGDYVIETADKAKDSLARTNTASVIATGLRYYERAGLIAPVARAPGGQRRYAASDMEWIEFLLRLRETQMPIGQMQAFARLRSEGNATAPERRQLLEQHLAQVLATITAMQQAAQALQAKIGHYQGLEASLRPTPSSTHQGSSHIPRNPTPLSPGPRQAARNRRPRG